MAPILHVVRYKRSELPKLARALAAKGYGLTLVCAIFFFASPGDFLDSLLSGDP